MKLKLYQVDAFAKEPFSGNPAAVCPLSHWLEDKVMQNIAMENNLAETAFYVEENGQLHIRWFTPGIEVDLCGHATLATAHVLFQHEGYAAQSINFQSKSGLLTVTISGDTLTLDFPTDPIQEVPLTSELTAGFNVKPIKAFKGKTDYMLIYDNQEQITDLEFDLRLISKVNARGIIVTAPGKDVDFVSRFFAPQSGVDEDPVTGSAHTSLTPFWSKALGKKELTAIQMSPRKGYLHCQDLGDRTKISGKAITYLIGEITV